MKQYNCLQNNLSIHLFITPPEFFFPALVDSLLLEFEWQQISSSL